MTCDAQGNIVLTVESPASRKKHCVGQENSIIHNEMQ